MTRKSLLFASAFAAALVLVIVMGVAASGGASVEQDAPIPTLPPAPDGFRGADPGAEGGQRLPEAPSDAVQPLPAPVAAETDFEFPQITDYRIAYLTTVEADQNTEFTTGAALDAALGADVYYEWGSFEESHTNEPYQGIVVNSSALEYIDTNVLHTAYRSNTIFIGLNTSREQMIQITGDQCKARGAGFTESGEFYVAYWHILSSHANDAALIHDAETVTCEGSGTIDDQVDGYRLKSGFSIIDFETERGVEAIGIQLVYNIAAVDAVHTSYIEMTQGE